ncbi:uncharacterized protein LOC116613159 [Nematostella vectensis]|uniref:uncharacterized protein LOC116613159 n=1 Tax=Nematostella vectensis TaxID=45351 RepID=UPI0020776101|nr:uncharacterized protein LOC116613159 [Nematostella vectensis]
MPCYCRCTSKKLFLILSVCVFYLTGDMNRLDMKKSVREFAERLLTLTKQDVSGAVAAGHVHEDVPAENKQDNNEPHTSTTGSDKPKDHLATNAPPVGSAAKQAVAAKKARPLVSTGACPVCGEHRAHLKAHLASNKPGHKWSEKRYRQWLYEKQSCTDRHVKHLCPKKNCDWVGVKLERHLEKSHNIEPKSHVMAKLRGKSVVLSKKQLKQDQEDSSEDETSHTQTTKKRPALLRTSDVAKSVGLVQHKKKKMKTSVSDDESDSDDDSESQIPYADNSDDDDDCDDLSNEENVLCARNRSQSIETVEEPHETEKEGENQDMACFEVPFEGVSGRGPFGPDSKPRNSYEVFMRGWNNHLATPDGTEKTDVRIAQMCSQVDKIAKSIHPSPKDLSVFLDKDIVYKRFFKANIELRKTDKSLGLTCKTLSTYSTSLERFLKYIIPLLYTSLSADKRKALKKLRDVQPSWRESWGKRIAEERAEREWVAEKNLPTLEEAKSLLESEHAQKMTKMLTSPKKYKLDLCDAQAARNYLIYLINNENTNRAGPVAEIKLSTFKKGIMKEGKWTIHIANQKTTKTLGGILIQFSSSLHHMILKYIEYFRPLMAANAKTNEDALFLNQTGTPYTNSHVHHALKQFAIRAGTLRPESVEGFCSSMIRHVVVTNTRGLSSPEKNNLASKMGHSRRTADLSYNLINKVKAANNAHDTMTNLWEGASSTEGNQVEAPEDENSAEEAKEEETGDHKTEQDDNETNTIPPSENANQAKFVSVGRMRSLFSQADTKVLQAACNQLITSKKAPTRSQILRQIRSDERAALISAREGEERTYQKVKGMRHKFQNSTNTR